MLSGITLSSVLYILVCIGHFLTITSTSKYELVHRRKNFVDNHPVTKGRDGSKEEREKELVAALKLPSKEKNDCQNEE